MPDFNVTPIVEGGVGAEVVDSVTVDFAMSYKPVAGGGTSDQAKAVIAALQREVKFRWEQRTALSFRLQDLRHELVRAGVDEMSPLYERFHSLTSTAEGWMHPGTLSEAASAHLAFLKRYIVELEEVRERFAGDIIQLRGAKDGAYLERNKVVAGLAAAWPAGVKRTAIEGWDPEWHGCVYIDLPTGQVSWHFHDSHAELFAHLPEYTGEWDGHTTDEKYARLAAMNGASWDQPIPCAAQRAVPVESLGREPDRLWTRDNEATHACILLVDGQETGFVGEDWAEHLARIASWTDEQCREVEEYCLAIHVNASDNDDFPIPAKPAVLGVETGAPA